MEEDDRGAPSHVSCFRFREYNWMRFLGDNYNNFDNFLPCGSYVVQVVLVVVFSYPSRLYDLYPFWLFYPDNGDNYFPCVRISCPCCPSCLLPLPKVELHLIIYMKEIHKKSADLPYSPTGLRQPQYTYGEAYAVTRSFNSVLIAQRNSLWRSQFVGEIEQIISFG